MQRLGRTWVDREHGFTMFEVLITIVVVSIGLLGLAGLQFAGLRAVNSAQEHTQAMLLVQDIEERIRANPIPAYDNVSLSSTSSPTSGDCVKKACTPTEMANYDLYQWYRLIVPETGKKPRLPNAAISITSNDGTNFQVVIQWGDPSGLQTLNASFTIS